MTRNKLRYLYNFLGLLFCLLPFHLKAQEEQIKDKKAEYENELSLGVGMQGAKINFGALYARNYSVQRAWLLSLEFSEIKSAKEKRNSTAIRTSNRGQSYVYGKINNLFVARLGLGQKIYFSDRRFDSNINLAFSYQGGFTLGMLKPYYLTLYYPTSNSNFTTRVEQYTAENRQYFLNPNNIAGTGGSGKGWSELSIKPGAFLKASFLIDMNTKMNALGFLEMGLIMDTFFSPIYILAETKANPLMFHVYATVNFGGRW